MLRINWLISCLFFCLSQVVPIGTTWDKQTLHCFFWLYNFANRLRTKRKMNTKRMRRKLFVLFLLLAGSFSCVRICACANRESVNLKVVKDSDDPKDEKHYEGGDKPHPKSRMPGRHYEMPCVEYDSGKGVLVFGCFSDMFFTYHVKSMTGEIVQSGELSLHADVETKVHLDALRIGEGYLLYLCVDDVTYVGEFSQAY